MTTKEKVSNQTRQIMLQKLILTALRDFDTAYCRQDIMSITAAKAELITPPVTSKMYTYALKSLVESKEIVMSGAGKGRGSKIYYAIAKKNGTKFKASNKNKSLAPVPEMDEILKSELKKINKADLPESLSEPRSGVHLEVNGLIIYLDPSICQKCDVLVMDNPFGNEPLVKVEYKRSKR